MSKEVEIVLPDGSKQKVAKGTTLFEIKNQLMEVLTASLLTYQLQSVKTRSWLFMIVLQTRGQRPFVNWSVFYYRKR